LPSTHGERLKHLQLNYRGDDLFACQPVAQAIQAAGRDVLLIAGPSFHKAFYDFMHYATPEEQIVTQKAPGKRLQGRTRRNRVHRGGFTRAAAPARLALNQTDAACSYRGSVGGDFTRS